MGCIDFSKDGILCPKQRRRKIQNQDVHKINSLELIPMVSQSPKALFENHLFSKVSQTYKVSKFWKKNLPGKCKSHSSWLDQ
jgi:hypothetical protein